MTDLTRRHFTALAGALALATPLFAPAVLGQGKPKLVVIGGGPGGGTVARYVNKDPKGAIEVTLIEPQKNFTTCFFSNIYVGGYRDFNSITHSYDKVRKEGVKVVHEAAAVDRPRQEAGRARRRRARALRPARRRARHRHQVRLACRAIRRRPPRSCRTPGSPGAQTELLVRKLNALQGRRHHRDDRAAQSLSLPARAVRARVDVRACAQDRRGTRNRRSSCSIRSRPSPSRRCSSKAGRSTIRA